MKIHTVKAKESYTVCYPDAISLMSGETVTVGRQDDEWPEFFWCVNDNGNAGWVPKSYFVQAEKMARMVRDYSAQELTVNKGDSLIVIEQLGGWVWVKNNVNELGWIPEKCIDQEG